MDYEQFKERLVAKLNEHTAKQGIKCSILPVNPKRQPEDTLYIGYNCEKPQLIGVKHLYELANAGKKDIPGLSAILINSYYTCNNIPTELDPTKLVCSLVNQKRFAGLLKIIPHIPFFDMAITLSQSVQMPDNTFVHMMVNENTLKAAGYQLNDLYWPALTDTFKQFPAKLLPPSAVFQKFLTFPPESSMDQYLEMEFVKFLEAKDPDRIYFLTCENYQYGGAAILNYFLLQSTAERLMRNLYILPYTTNAFAVVPQDNTHTDDFIIDMVRGTPPAKESDILTEKILYYDRASKQLTEIATVTGENRHE